MTRRFQYRGLFEVKVRVFLIFIGELMRFNIWAYDGGFKVYSLLLISAGISPGKKCFGGIGVKKERSKFHVLVSNVATEINPAQEQVLIFLSLVPLDSVHALCD